MVTLAAPAFSSTAAGASDVVTPWLIAGVCIAIVLIFGADFISRGKYLAMGAGFALFAGTMVGGLVVGGQLEAERATAHRAEVASWLSSEYDVNASDDAVRALLSDKPIEVTVDGAPTSVVRERADDGSLALVEAAGEPVLPTNAGRTK